MGWWPKSTMTFRRVSRLVGPCLLMLCWAGTALADVCVWRDPERTMQRIFPTARDYKTITIKVTPATIVAIEKAIGAPLDASEKSEFNFYELTGKTGGKVQTLGTIMALAGKGEYGAIEVVIGIDKGGKVVSAYIQRARERTTKELQSASFLKQFVGKTKADGLEVGKDIQPPSAKAEPSSRVVASTIKKMLVFDDVLTNGVKRQ